MKNTLFFVGQVCDRNKFIVYTATEGVVLSLTVFSFDKNDVVAIPKPNQMRCLYEIEGYIRNPEVCLRLGANGAKPLSPDINICYIILYM